MLTILIEHEKTNNNKQKKKKHRVNYSVLYELCIKHSDKKHLIIYSKQLHL